MQGVSKYVSVDVLYPLNLRPVTEERVKTLKDSITKNGYDPSCPLIIQRNGAGYLVVNGCHRLRTARELNIKELPVVEYPADEDPVRIALRTQENDEYVQPWDFLDRAFLVKKLYEELGTQEKVAQRLGWTQQSVSYYLQIARLPKNVTTEIRNSVVKVSEESVVEEYNGRCRKNLDDLWKPTWFRHICTLPNDELKLAVVKKIAESPEKWKEKDVASECTKLRKRHEVLCKIEAQVRSGRFSWPTPDETRAGDLVKAEQRSMVSVYYELASSLMRVPFQDEYASEYIQANKEFLENAPQDVRRALFHRARRAWGTFVAEHHLYGILVESGKFTCRKAVADDISGQADLIVENGCGRFAVDVHTGTKLSESWRRVKSRRHNERPGIPVVELMLIGSSYSKRVPSADGKAFITLFTPAVIQHIEDWRRRNLYPRTFIGRIIGW
ncbi:MAG: ParB N-terminal domain-containing protein [Thermacetogeniaceae bacterium]